MIFDWDNANTAKCQKHGLSIKEIEYVLSTNPNIVPDPFPDEMRLRAIGRNSIGRFVFIVFVPRMIDKGMALRPISARYMHQKEVDRYFNTPKE